MAVRKDTSVTGKLHELVELSEQVRRTMPHLSGVLSAESDFRGINVKVKSDGTTLAVLKSYDSGGAPIVCFGVGYGFWGCLLAVDAAVQGNNWRVDKYP